MASPTFQTATENSGDSATPTILEPSGAATGNLLVAVVGSASEGTAIAGFTGWTTLREGDDGQGNRYWMGWIIRGASAPDLVGTAANAKWVAMCIRITGHNASTPIAANATPATGSGTNPDPPSATPSGSNDYLAIAATIQEGKNDNRFTDTTPSGYTERADIGTAGGGAATGHIGGAMNTRAYTGTTEDPGAYTSATNDGWVALTVIVAPAPAPVSVALVAATATAGAQALDLSLTAHSHALSFASATVAAQAFGVTADPLSIALSPATLTAAAQALNLNLSALSVSLVAATPSVAAQIFGVTVGGSPVTVALVPGTITVAAQALDVSLSALSIALSPGTLTASGQPLDLSLGALSVAMTPATLTAVAQALAVSASPLAIVIVPATMTVTAQPLDKTLGALNISLEPGTLVIVAQPFGVDNGAGGGYDALRVAQVGYYNVW